MKEWVAEHGYKVPDHPAIFKDPEADWPIISKTQFMTWHGDDGAGRVWQEYVAAGGILPSLGVAIRTEDNMTFKEFEQTWNASCPMYVTDFACGPVCRKMRERIRPKVAKIFASADFGPHFLVGGPRSGLPFHRHQRAWQGLLSGRKAWYFVPPGRMSPQVDALTGPWLLPARLWADRARPLPVGERPLYCEQLPGEIAFIPDNWWHATYNLGPFQLAYGGKSNLGVPSLDGTARAQELAAAFGRDEAPQVFTWGPIYVILKDLAPGAPYEKQAEAVRLLEASLGALVARADEERSGWPAAPGGSPPFDRLVSAAHCVLAEMAGYLAVAKGWRAFGEAAGRWEAIAKRSAPEVYLYQFKHRERLGLGPPKWTGCTTDSNSPGARCGQEGACYGSRGTETCDRILAYLERREPETFAQLMAQCICDTWRGSTPEWSAAARFAALAKVPVPKTPVASPAATAARFAAPAPSSAPKTLAASPAAAAAAAAAAQAPKAPAQEGRAPTTPAASPAAAAARPPKASFPKEALTENLAPGSMVVSGASVTLSLVLLLVCLCKGRLRGKRK